MLDGDIGTHPLRHFQIENITMTLQRLLNYVKNAKIEFVTIRSDDSIFSTLERRIVITGPAELVQLAEVGDPRVLDELVIMLCDPARAWAAEVLLATMTHTEEKIVDAFAAHPNEWWNSIGQTAYERWKTWLSEMRGRLVWDNCRKYFMETK